MLSLHSGFPARTPPIAMQETGGDEPEPASPTAAWLSRLVSNRDVPACVVEVERRDARVDYRFVAVSPAFAAATGIADAVGRTMRELRPDHEQFWFDLYDRVDATGEPAHFEHAARALDSLCRGISLRQAPAHGPRR